MISNVKTLFHSPTIVSAPAAQFHAHFFSEEQFLTGEGELKSTPVSKKTSDESRLFVRLEISGPSLVARIVSEYAQPGIVNKVMQSLYSIDRSAASLVNTEKSQSYQHAIQTEFPTIKSRPAANYNIEAKEKPAIIHELQPAPEAQVQVYVPQDVLVQTTEREFEQTTKIKEQLYAQYNNDQVSSYQATHESHMNENPFYQVSGLHLLQEKDIVEYNPNQPENREMDERKIEYTAQPQIENIKNNYLEHNAVSFELPIFNQEKEILRPQRDFEQRKNNYQPKEKIRRDFPTYTKIDMSIDLENPTRDHSLDTESISYEITAETSTPIHQTSRLEAKIQPQNQTETYTAKSTQERQSSDITWEVQSSEDARPFLGHSIEYSHKTDSTPSRDTDYSEPAITYSEEERLEIKLDQDPHKENNERQPKRKREYHQKKESKKEPTKKSHKIEYKDNPTTSTYEQKKEYTAEPTKIHEFREKELNIPEFRNESHEFQYQKAKEIKTEVIKSNQFEKRNEEYDSPELKDTKIHDFNQYKIKNNAYTSNLDSLVTESEVESAPPCAVNSLETDKPCTVNSLENIEDGTSIVGIVKTTQANNCYAPKTEEFSKVESTRDFESFGVDILAQKGIESVEDLIDKEGNIDITKFGDSYSLLGGGVMITITEEQENSSFAYGIRGQDRSDVGTTYTGMANEVGAILFKIFEKNGLTLDITTMDEIIEGENYTGSNLYVTEVTGGKRGLEKKLNQVIGKEITINDVQYSIVVKDATTGQEISCNASTGLTQGNYTIDVITKIGSANLRENHQVSLEEINEGRNLDNGYETPKFAHLVHEDTGERLDGYALPELAFESNGYETIMDQFISSLESANADFEVKTMNTQEYGQEKGTNLRYVRTIEGVIDNYMKLHPNAQKEKVGILLMETESGKIMREPGYGAEGLDYAEKAGKSYVPVIYELGADLSNSHVELPKQNRENTIDTIFSNLAA